MGCQIDMTKSLDLRNINFKDGHRGRLTWPIPYYDHTGENVILPSGKSIPKDKLIKKRMWDEETEYINHEYLNNVGIDTIIFRIGNTIEVACYNVNRILKINMLVMSHLKLIVMVVVLILVIGMKLQSIGNKTSYACLINMVKRTSNHVAA